MINVEEHSRQSFSIVYVDGTIRAEASNAANQETVILLTRCMQHVLMQALARGRRASNDSVVDAPMAKADETAIQVCIPTVPQADSVGDDKSTDDPRIFEPSPQTGLWLTEAIEKWRVDTTFAHHSWTYSYKPSFRLFREMVGDVRRNVLQEDGTAQNILDIPMSRLTRSHIEDFVNAMREMPQRQGKRTDGVEAKERLRIARQEKLPAQSLANTAKKLLHIRPFLRWAKQKGVIDQTILDELELGQRAADAAVVKAAAKKKHQPGYVALSERDLKAVFESRGFWEGALKADWRYWVPLLCLYLGLRIAEASQIYRDDLIYVDGVLCISVISDDSDEDNENERDNQHLHRKSPEEYRRVKNEASRRIIPVHPMLLALGFMDFVQSLKSSKSSAVHLFSGLHWEVKSMFGRAPSNQFGNLMREVGVAEKRRKVPHSLRSNFHQALAKTMLPAPLQDRLLGHSTNSTKDEHYNETDQGRAIPAAQVLPYLEKMDYGLRLPTWSEITGQRAKWGRR